MKKILVLVMLALAGAINAQAQTLIDNSTLSSAVATTDTVISMGSVTCTGCTFGYDTLIYVDLEAMRVERSYVSGATNIPVRRATDGTKLASHKSGAVTQYGPGQRFYQADPKIGTCGPRSSQLYLPWINVNNGKVWTCDGNPNVWRSTVIYSETTNSRTLSRRADPTEAPTLMALLRDAVRW